MKGISDILYRPYITPSKPLRINDEENNDYPLKDTLPEYLSVDVKDPVRQWKVNHETEMFEKLITSQKELRESAHKSKDDMATMLRKVPVDLITKDFLNKEELTIDGRAYIIDKLIPVVVLGLEKVLKEADMRGLIERKEREPNFNPIDFLAQYLMRNNPLFSNYNEASPYVRGLRQVVEELKMEIFQLSDNKLAKVKAAAITRRDEREKEEARKKREAKRRIEIYQKLFDQFLVRNQSKVDYETIHISIKTFSEIAAKFPDEMKSKIAPILTLRYSELSDKLLSRKDFALLISHYADEMPLDIFDQFAEHLSKCAQLYRGQMEKDIRKKLLSELFITCDLDEMGLLDRKRILMLFDQFYSKTPDNIKMMLRDPRHWPISDYKNEKVVNNNPDNQNQNATENKNVNAADTKISEDLSEYDEDKNQNFLFENNEEDITTEKTILPKKTDDIEENLDDVKEETINVVEQVDYMEEKTEEVGLNVVECTDKEYLNTIAIKVSKNDLDEDGSNVPEEEIRSLEKENMEFLDVTQQRFDNASEDVLETLNDFEDIETLSFSGEENNTPEKLDEAFNREITKLSTITSTSAPYDDENITFSQFFQVTEEFLGDIPSVEVLDELIEFLREGYQETVEERLKRLQKAHRMVISSRRRNIIDDLFNVWDKDNIGFLSLKEVSEMLLKYRNGILVDGVKAGKKEARMRQTRLTKDVRLNRKEFRTFIFTIAKVAEMMDDESEVETMVHYFIGIIQKTYEEKLRGEARSKWLNSILWAADVSCGSMEGVYRAVFQALYKDAEMHGGGKIISGSLALLENNEKETEKRGKYTLHFVASTNDQCDYVVGKKLDRSMKNISFQAVYTGNIVSLNHASGSPLVVYWNPKITENAKEGSLVIVPIKDDFQRVFGVLSVDTLNDPNPEKAIFFSYEISFFQGVSKQFSVAFKQVEMLRRLVKITESAMIWICRRTESIKGANLYLKEKKDQKNITEFILRHVLSSNDHGEVTKLQKPTRMDKSDNLFKTYLFDTIETSQPTTADAYGDRNIAIPLRDLDGVALAVMEINIGSKKLLPSAENTDVAKMMKLLQQSFIEIIKISQIEDDIDPKDSDEGVDLESPEYKALIISATGRSNVDIIFDQYMLAELKATITKLDAQAYAEIKSYKEPPATIHAIIQASLSLLYPNEGNLGLFENWEKCKKYISLSMSKLILAFDPFGDVSMLPMAAIQEVMKKIPRSEIDRHSSKPALDIYNWVFCCVTLIIHGLSNV